MKKILTLLLALWMLLSLAACKNAADPIETTPVATEPMEDGQEHYDLNEIDLEGIGELLAKNQMDTYSKIRLDGLCTPVTLELEGTDILSVSAYGTTACVSAEGKDYASIYGNLQPVIYDHEGIIFLNVWHNDTGYSCVIFPDGTYTETYPDDLYSVMIYLDEENRMCQSQFALKFEAIEQWDTGPIDQATSRDDFYYSIDDASWTAENGYVSVSRESYTISDWFDLDEIFNTAKADGLYPDFETLDQLLAYNVTKNNSDDDSEPLAPSREEVILFDQVYASYDYDEQHNLTTETFYESDGTAYFVKTHAYDDQGLEIAGTWTYRDQAAYRYTKAYTKQGLLGEVVWYVGDREVERFSYTHHSDGTTTKTFSQSGEKKYTYTFDDTSALVAHSIYQNGTEIKTEDVTSLVETDLLTDIWLPIIDNDPIHSAHYYNGTVPAENPSQWNATTAADGSRILTRSETDNEDGLLYIVEHHYDLNDRLQKVIYKQEGREYRREEYEYVGNICVRKIGYDNGVKEYTCENKYSKGGQLIRSETSYETPQSYYIVTDENGDSVDREVTYTVRTEAYRYDDLGQLVETVVYEDGEEQDRTAYDYNVCGNIIPRLDTYEYMYDIEGNPEGIWLIYEDHAVGAALLRCHRVYVTPENARQLQEIFRNEISWF